MSEILILPILNKPSAFGCFIILRDNSDKELAVYEDLTSNTYVVDRLDMPQSTDSLLEKVIWRDNGKYIFATPLLCKGEELGEAAILSSESGSKILFAANADGKDAVLWRREVEVYRNPNRNQ